tara:strand:- start:508 stop:1164 length:657 start_codon:yes stop_codon:yes gene_type:complete
MTVELVTQEVKAKKESFLEFENFLHKDDFDKITTNIQDADLPWHWNTKTAGKVNLPNLPQVRDCGQFVHILHDSRQNGFSPYSQIAEIITDALRKTLQIDIDIIDRIKLNCMTPQPNWERSQFNMPHCDKHLEGGEDINYLTAIYYINDSDGPTYFFNKYWGDTFDDMDVEDYCIPKANKLILFHSTKYHTSSPPIKYDRRIVVNAVYKVKEKNGDVQ